MNIKRLIEILTRKDGTNLLSDSELPIYVEVTYGELKEVTLVERYKDKVILHIC